MSFVKDNEKLDFDTIVIKVEPSELNFGKCNDKLNINEIFLPEVKAEIYENEYLENTSNDQDLNEKKSHLNTLQTNENATKSTKLKVESPKSREKRLVRSKLYYRMRKAKQNGEFELLEMYEKEKNKNKLETLEERVQRLESEGLPPSVKVEDESKRRVRLEWLLQLKKIKDIMKERKKITQAQLQTLEMLKLVKEQKKKVRLRHLIMLHQTELAMKTKAQIND